MDWRSERRCGPSENEAAASVSAAAASVSAAAASVSAAAASVSAAATEDSAERGETSPEMLKNTPSNIRRLAHEIEQFRGRQKYLAQTRSPSDGGDVRWYFCKVPLLENALAASMPRTEIVGKGDYFRFGMRDSLAIEACFLQKEEELLSAWWKEYAECSEGPRGWPTSASQINQHRSVFLESSQSTQFCAIEEERVGVPVKGGLYEVDLERRHCFPVYWNGENRRVLRGHWFARKNDLDWFPVREDVAEQLEYAYRSQVWHRRTFQLSGLFAARVDLQGSTPGLHALFTGEDDTWEAWLNVDASGFSTIVSLGGKGIKLRRGYASSNSVKPTQDELHQQKEEEMDDYCSQVPVRHLVFMVHGIGQRLEKSNLVDDVANFRHITAHLAEQHLSSYQRGTQRVLFIPCQWRRGLKLSGETAVEKITLDGVRGLRVMLSATVHDVLYYMSPIYCQSIIDSVSNQLNFLYLKFRKRNPGYDGKVSVYGHSLGSVLSYDILCHQTSLISPFPMDWMYKEHEEKECIPHNHYGQSSNGKATYNGLIENSENDDVISPTDEKHAVISYSPQVPPISSNLDESSAKIVGSKIPNDISSLDGGPVITSEKGGLDANFEKIDGEGPEIDENKTVKLLRDEIDSLKHRILELECQCSDKVTKETTLLENQSITRPVQAGRDDKLKSYTPYVKYKKLEFKVDTFFAVGSPLGVFLALRNVRIGIGKGLEYWEEENINEEMPACQQMFNIFHPFDPVAYRIEPLICKEYINKRPVIIPYHRGGKRLHIALQEISEGFASRSQAIIDRLSFVRVKVLTLCQPRKNDMLDEVSENVEKKEDRSYGSLMMERLTGKEDGRIDHMLQDKTFRHPYISAIGSHTNYWRDYDTALFILKHLYRDIPEDPTLLDETKDTTNEHESDGWFDQREATDEELPLTFANKALIKNLSRRPRKIMK